ncbi:hypothetical protein DFR58_103168 [Anaerobacterium chartisolvens]|uniref:DUF4879 domain-containing protein n=1 Tax=Anaerobacterium chartisolvens TaxID=1297424 RepID=A0A369BD09_9FIRM|nr:hypothetical protein [Anaerobacterium chartisolvens]RCX19423.1 hypothetical protein DFR58_103168 [Anaerobacterium chartisolvens]
MIRKALKTMSLCLVLVLCFSITTFAYDDSGVVSENIQISDQKITSVEGDANGGVTTRAPAPPVTNVGITNAFIQNGNVYVEVTVIGYGDQYAYYDSSRVTSYTTVYLGSYEVYGFVYTYNCGPATVGSHSFSFRTTSFNSPWNTMTASATLTIS